MTDTIIYIVLVPVYVHIIFMYRISIKFNKKLKILMTRKLLLV